MNCRSLRIAALSAAVLSLTGVTVMGQTIPLFTFEINEGATLANPHGGANSTTGLDGAVGGVGITQGAQAFIINDIPPANDSTELSYQMSSSGVGEEANNYNAFVSAYNAIVSGFDVYLTYDYGYDATGVTTQGFFQPGIALNSDQGFSERRFGNLLEGNIGPGGNFPILDAGAAAGGATMTVLDPSNFATGDMRGVIRVRIPVGTAGDLELLNIGPGGNATHDFFQIFFHSQGGWQGTQDWSIDRVGFDVIPEPASLAISAFGLVALALLRRRR